MCKDLPLTPHQEVIVLHRRYILVNTRPEDRSTLRRALYSTSRVISEDTEPLGLYKDSLISIVETTTSLGERDVNFLVNYQAERLRSFSFGAKVYETEGEAMDGADEHFRAFPEDVVEPSTAQRVADMMADAVREWEI